jgi:hypothetical protein
MPGRNWDGTQGLTSEVPLQRQGDLTQFIFFMLLTQTPFQSRKPFRAFTQWLHQTLSFKDIKAYIEERNPHLMIIGLKWIEDMEDILNNFD